MANHSLNPNRNGLPLQAVISFSAFRVLPQRSAQLERYPSSLVLVAIRNLQL